MAYVRLSPDPTRNLVMNSANVWVQRGDVDSSDASRAANTYQSFGFKDANDRYLAFLQNANYTDGTSSAQLYARAFNGSSDVNNGLRLDARPDGTHGVSLSHPADWLAALGLDYRSTTAVADIIAAASGITVTAATYAQRGVLAQLNVTAKGFTTSTGAQAVGTVAAGKRPPFMRYEPGTAQALTYCSLNSAGTLSTWWNAAPSPTTAYTFSFVYLLA